MSWIIFKWTFIHWIMAFNVLDHFQVNIYPSKFCFKCLGSFSSEHIHRNMAFDSLDLFQVNIYPLKCGFKCLGSVSSEHLSIEIWLLISLSSGGFKYFAGVSNIKWFKGTYRYFSFINILVQSNQLIMISSLSQHNAHDSDLPFLRRALVLLDKC